VAAVERVAAAVRVAEVAVLPVLEAMVEVLGLAVAEVEEVVGRRAAAVVVAVVVFLSAVVRPGLDMMELVRRAAELSVGFFSSSLALTLGRLRWLAAEVVGAAVERRAAVVVVVGGRVGGLARPPAVRVEVVAVAVLELVAEDAVPGRRVVVVEVVAVPGRLAAAGALDSPLALGVPLGVSLSVSLGVPLGVSLGVLGVPSGVGVASLGVDGSACSAAGAS